MTADQRTGWGPVQVVSRRQPRGSLGDVLAREDLHELFAELDAEEA